MTEDVAVVIAEPLERPALPAWLNGAVLLLHLVRTGRWGEIAKRLRVQREGGYAGIDGFLFLLLYFGSHSNTGLKRFSERASLHGEKLAALGGRDRLPQQSSMSRILSAVELDVVRPLGPWLLRHASGAADILGHPAMQTRDANGKFWLPLDYDPTKTAVRQRGLPEGEDLPPPRRRAEGFAAPGYAGHKRGEVQVSRATLQHAGSGLWLDARLSPGNGDGCASLASAIAVATEVCAELGHPLHRALLRMDGEFGHVPYLSMCLEAGLPALSRLNRPKLLDQPDVRRRMASGPWYRVPDSRSGPTRSAMDLGMVTVPPGRDTLRDDGTSYEPIEVRVVVSRYERTGEAEHGRVIDGWQYELFAAVLLPADAWPAPDVVAAYFGRGGQENRFAQEDRELELDRVFSYNLAGQELACLVGLMVWNMEVVHGFHLNRPPVEQAPAQARQQVVDERPVPDGFASYEETVEDAVEDEVEDAVAPEPVRKSSEEDPHATLADAQRGLDWPHMLRRREGWTFDDEDAVLRCPVGEAMSLTTVVVDAGPKTSRLSFRALAGACRACPSRAACLSSAGPDAVKLTSFAVPRTSGQQLSALLEPVHRARRLERSTETLALPPPSGHRRRTPVGTPLAVDFEAGTAAPGSAQIRVAPFLPAEARKAFRRAAESLAVRVSVRKPQVEPQHPYLARGPEQRQRRRATWNERLAWYALPAGSKVEAVLHGGNAVARAFPWTAKT